MLAVPTWIMFHVVDPSLALLHTNAAPLCLRHQVSLGHQLCNVLWKHDVPAHSLKISKQCLMNDESDYNWLVLLPFWYYQLWQYVYLI